MQIGGGYAIRHDPPKLNDIYFSIPYYLDVGKRVCKPPVILLHLSNKNDRLMRSHKTVDAGFRVQGDSRPQNHSPGALIRNYLAHLREAERSTHTISKYAHDLNALLAWLGGGPLDRSNSSILCRIMYKNACNRAVTGL